MNTGKFITLEGGEGAGKTTNLEFIVEYLNTRGKSVMVSREPGGTLIGEEIRSLLLKKSQQPISKDTELLLMFAARAQHINEKILPGLKGGHWVVCDRYIDASYAYQGGGRNININKINILVDLFTKQLEPDLTLLLDVPVDIGMSRVKQRSIPDRFESEQLSFFHAVRHSYLSRAATFPNRIKKIDSSQSLALIQSEISQNLDFLLAS